ncbi:unnamed protein product [Clonostachys rosea f. rosea IK726]|uniref:Uncharacterized protein n=1 Tax=Clonostachys rosea f. rosea IK726 TaxID=1349383 RepID=A0ACA9TM68_BIOOC|nr:unnamed protein product [Clonostachys rosea f. rosea IK726]
MPMRQPSELTSQDLRAPVSAMHNLSQNEESRHHSSSSTDTTSCTDQTQRKASGILFGRNVKQKDMVSKGIIDHQQARQLFTSFEALRFREPFCFGVILTLACCIDGLLQREECLEEIKALVAGTLFDCPATIGTVQGMMLLVVYAENTWFAIGHALQIAQDLKLDQILPNQQVQNQSGVSENIGQQRRTMRNARVWLALCLIEREVAIGTARSCRIPKIPAADLTYFTHQSLTHPPNMRFASLVEAVQVRDEFLSEITEAGDLQDTGLRRLNHMESKFEEWLQNWDAHHRGCMTLGLEIDYGYDISSFQRTGLRGQKNYALIFLGCATISKISGNRQLSRAVKDSSGTLPRTVDFVMAIALKQLQLILESESYRWHLKWATNYTVLSLTFTCIFALEMSKHRDDLNAPKVLTTVRGIAAILAGYHDPFFYQLIQARLSHHPGASSYMIPEQSSQNQAGVCHNSKTRSAQCETASAAVCSTQFQLPHSSLRQSLLPDMDFTPQSPLSQLLETPDWMLNPSSMLVFDANDWQNNDTSDVNY